MLSEHIAIEDLMALCRFILYPHDDYNLACLLKSQLFELSENELLELRCAEPQGETQGPLVAVERAAQRGSSNVMNTCHNRDCTLWKSLCHKAETLATAANACRVLGSLLEEPTLHSPYRLFAHVLDVLKLRTNFVRKFGTYINEILDGFLELCLDGGDSLVLFMHWFDNGKFEFKRDTNLHDHDAVKLMTVHAAKGLQAKLVILPDTIGVPQPASNGILFDLYTGDLLCGGKHAAMVPAYATLLNRIKMQELQEYYRLLYVALTRASERLLICGWSNRQHVHQDSWYSVLSSVYQEHNKLFASARYDLI
jgi:ATP-dependent helicase/nuclease subunit A